MGNVASRFAFYPPTPPTYEVLEEKDGMKLIFSPLPKEKNVEVHRLETKSGNKIIAIFWKHPFARFTFLYSHGNAADLGQMIDLFMYLRAQLRVNIMSYDYSGYGASTGKGTSDEVVDCTHGKQLWENCKEKYEPLWVKGGGHCDLEAYPEYLKHMRKFLNAMEKPTTKGETNEQVTQNPIDNESKRNKCLGFG
ncbi:Alpha/beta hydrolase domain-containing proteinB [Arachis hypogaea]|nr:Alpha/beta hydrolase domain-containing proteinB [Arachis hypogaea]